MEYKPLTYFCNINMGQSPDSNTYNNKSNGLPFYQGNADFGEIHPNTRVWCSKPIKIAYKNDVLISVRAPIGALNIANNECCIGRGLASLTPNIELTTTNYLLYALKSKVNELNQKGTGSTFKAISKKVLEETTLPFYSIDQQQKIVAILDQVNHLISLRTKQLEQLDLLIKSRFVEMFGDIITNSKYNKVPLSNLAKVGSSKRIFANEYLKEGIPFYRSKEIRELGEGIKPSIELYISNDRYESIKKQFGIPKFGDILVAAIGATIGYTWRIDTVNPFYYKDGNLIWISLFDGINSIFLNFALTILIKDYKNKGIANGSAQLALTIEKVGQMLVPNAPRALQNQFAAFVEEVDKTKATVKQSLEWLNTLKAKLMQDYFG